MVHLHSQHVRSSFCRSDSFSSYLSDTSCQNRDPPKLTNREAAAGHFNSTEVQQNLLDVLQLGRGVRGDVFSLLSSPKDA